VLVIDEAVEAEVTISEGKHGLAPTAMAPIKQDVASTRRRNTVLKSSPGRYGAETLRHWDIETRSCPMSVAQLSQGHGRDGSVGTAAKLCD
jgi:hypothetical protein